MKNKQKSDIQLFYFDYVAHVEHSWHLYENTLLLRFHFPYRRVFLYNTNRLALQKSRAIAFPVSDDDITKSIEGICIQKEILLC